jgi:glycerol-3-phosphate dehydrogenase
LGGGATGTGCVRDAAMRGFRTVLVERADLSTGTTGRYHGLLHSGGRYVVRDPHAAAECIRENRILRKIMPHCIEDTGGFFVLTPFDNPDYAPRFLEGCHAAGVPVEEITVEQMLKEEPLLNPQISRCFRVPDASADSFLGSESNAESARQHGAQILNYHEVISLVREGDRVTGALVRDLVNDEEVTIQADMVINALGAWCGKVAATAGVPITIVPGKGVMLALNHRIVNTVINRCKLPSDGDILVPAHTVAVIGTTDTPIPDPDRLSIEPWEVDLMLQEGEKLIPGMSQMRFLRAWAGVRPLYREAPEQPEANRDVSRAFALLDHAKRDGVEGVITITSGKWTTYRKMAEEALDLACQKLKVARSCWTADEALPGADHGHHYLGVSLAKTEKAQAYGSLICECEMVTVDEVRDAILKGDPKTIDDVRRDSRIGMGPCQGGFCTMRVAGMLHELKGIPVETVNASLRDFLQERWKGLLPVLWGQQLRQERLDELIYLSVLNASQLPGPQVTQFASHNYEMPEDRRPQTADRDQIHGTNTANTVPAVHGRWSAVADQLSAAGPSKDVIVIGAGLAGLTTAWQAAERGCRVKVVSKGMGALYWNAGCIDVAAANPNLSPREAVERLIAANPRHPYAITGLDALEEAMTALQELAQEMGYPLRGSLERNWLLPTALGTLRPTCLAPDTMTAGDMGGEHASDPTLIAGFAGFGDFTPGWIAANLHLQGTPAEGMQIELPELNARNFVSTRLLASLFEQPGFRERVIEEIKPRLNGAVRVGFPACLGLDHPMDVIHELEQHLGVHVFEIPSLPPSIPGMRLAKLLVRAIELRGGQVFDGMQASGFQAADGRIVEVLTEASTRMRPHRAEQFVLATGGILGGGIFAEYSGQLRETVLGLPVEAPTSRHEWLSPQFLPDPGHPVYSTGLEVNESFQPVDAAGKLLLNNLYCAGSLLAHADPIRERSLEGIALATGWRVGCGLNKNE